MTVDSEPLQKPAPNNFMNMIHAAVGGIQFKLFGIILIVFMFLSSDIFITRVLGKFSGAVEQKCPTSWGTLLQGLFLVAACILIDTAVNQGII